MISLLVSFAVLILGYFLYSRVTEKVFGADRVTPAFQKLLNSNIQQGLKTAVCRQDIRLVEKPRISQSKKTVYSFRNTSVCVEFLYQ